MQIRCNSLLFLLSVIMVIGCGSAKKYNLTISDIEPSLSVLNEESALRKTLESTSRISVYYDGKR